MKTKNGKIELNIKNWKTKKWKYKFKQEKKY